MTYAQARLAAIRARKAAEKTQTITPVVGSQRVAIKSTFPMATEANAAPYMQTRNAIVNAHREQNPTNTPSTLENTSMFDLNTMTVHIFPVTKSEIRAITDERGDPWFLAMDIAAALGYSDAYKLTSRLDEDEIQNLQIGGFGNRGVNIISESGLYEAILGSHKPEAKEFKRWVKREVLPSIRKTGAYSMQQQPALPNFADPVAAARAWADAQEKAQVLALENQRTQAALDYAAPRASTYDRVIAHKEITAARSAASPCVGDFVRPSGDRKLPGVNSQSIKKCLMDLGYFYKRQAGIYKVRSQYRDKLFAEGMEGKYGSDRGYLFQGTRRSRATRSGCLRSG